MTFIMILVSLVIERFFHWTHLRHWRWFLLYQRWLGHSRVANWSSIFLLIVSVLPPVLLVGGVSFLLSGFLYGIFEIIFGIIILMYCLGPTNLWVQVYTSINELYKDDPSIAIEQVTTAFGISMPDNSQAFHQAFVRAIFIAAYKRVFAVIFWFALLGPAGALLYRLIALSATESPLGVTKLATKSQQVLDWIPVRLFTFIFALGGHFTNVITQWKKNLLQGLDSNKALLTECGISALDVLNNNFIPEDGSAEKEAVGLLDRVFVMSLAILAVIVLLT